jgi:putative transposase
VIGRLDLSEERERLEREQRALSRKQYDSNNWNHQRKRVATVHSRMTAKKRDFKHKLAHYYTTYYKAVFLEDLNVRGMLEQPANARNKHEAGWRDLITIFKPDRDWNAALNILIRGLTKLGVVHSEETPVETATTVSADGGLSSHVADARCVVEAGSAALKEVASAAE